MILIYEVERREGEDKIKQCGEFITQVSIRSE